MLNRISQVSALLLLLSIAPADAGDWYRFHGPDMNGISSETGWQTQWPQEGPRQLWKTSVGIGFSSMTVSHGRVYTMGNDGAKTNAVDTVYCLDAATGAEIWKHSYPCILHPRYYEGGPGATPTVDGDRVYTISGQGDLFCLDAAKGKVLWSINVATNLGNEIPEWGFAGSPVVDGKLLVLNVGSQGIALDKKTGKVVWASDKGPAGYGTPMPFDWNGRHCLAIMGHRSFDIVQAADGKPLWSLPWKSSWDVNATDPVIFDKKIFISSGYNKIGSTLIDISTDKPAILWENNEFRSHLATTILWKGFLYGVDDVAKNRYELKCLDPKTGAIKWAEPSLGKGSLMMAGGKFIGLTDTGTLMVIEPSPDGFKTLAKAQVLGGRCWTVPVLANGRIYCRNAKGDFICLDVSGKQPST